MHGVSIVVAGSHGHTVGGFSPTYYSWASMLTRCTNPNSSGWKNYGARGITVCDRWRSFDNFLADMGDRPVGLTLDRKDNDGNYEPANCRWATPVEQARNKRKPLAQALQRALRSGPMTLAELHARLPFHEEQVNRVVRSLRRDGKLTTHWVPGVGRGRTLKVEMVCGSHT